MRVGVLTFHRAYNYGASLQAYALTSILHRLGADAQIIDYRSPALKGSAKLVKTGEKASPELFSKILFRMIKHRRFDAFDRQRLTMSPMVTDESGLVGLARDYDAVIVGSDQVWNDDITNSDGAFYLDFMQGVGERFSYAASFGGKAERADGVASRHREELGRFSSISLRERGGIDRFESKFGDKVRCDVDPVLLMGGEAWGRIAGPRLLKMPYLFMYLVGDECNIRKFAESYSKRHGLILVDNKRSIEFLKHNGPEDFLSWILHADAVATNSFHGTAFSVLFEKNAYYELGKGESYNYRVASLLEAVGIVGHEILGPDAPAADEQVDWKTVESRLADLKEDSLAYLEQIVSSCEAAEW